MRQTTPWAHSSAPPPQHPAPLGWKSPVPYLFGGLAAMLGLIAFALLILACSYWKLSRYQDAHNDHDSAGGKVVGGREKEKADSVVGVSVLVIMAGDENPTFLATPASDRVSLFGSDESDGRSSGRCCGGGGGDGEEEKMGSGDNGVVAEDR